MKYEWENDAEDAIYPLVEKINEKMPYGFSILGVAVENEQTGEAFYMSMFENDGSVLLSDLMQDVVGDAREFYNLTLKNRQ
jgi:hypothetical protein